MFFWFVFYDLLLKKDQRNRRNPIKTTDKDKPIVLNYELQFCSC